MKTIVYMSLSVDGYFRQPDARHPIPQEILMNFGQFVSKAGNIINGRKTYDGMVALGAVERFANIDLVVVSHDATLQAEGIHFVVSPEAAIQYLHQKGAETALIGGGVQLYSAFFSERLVDELYLNVEPWIANKGVRLNLSQEFEANLRLVETTQLGGNIIQLHYEVEK